jgi:hypothetical protein
LFFCLRRKDGDPDENNHHDDDPDNHSYARSLLRPRWHTFTPASR